MTRHLHLLHNAYAVDRHRDAWLDPPDPVWECFLCGDEFTHDPHGLPDNEVSCKDCCTDADCVECYPPSQTRRNRNDV